MGDLMKLPKGAYSIGSQLAAKGLLCKRCNAIKGTCYCKMEEKKKEEPR